MEALAQNAGPSGKTHLLGSHDLKISNAEVVAALETITPEIATTWLERNIMNRPLNRRQIDMIKDDLLKGDWAITGETICFCKGTNGSISGAGVALIDGQNRLTAIAESGVTVQSIVVRGLEKKVFAKTGNGKPRSGGDILAVTSINFFCFLQI